MCAIDLYARISRPARGGAGLRAVDMAEEAMGRRRHFPRVGPR
jgi:hypothetical protein